MLQNVIAPGHLERIRAAELETVRPWMRPGVRVLEIGGGSGFQASQLAAWGCDVVSLDVHAGSSGLGRYHPVQPYDGVHIPFPERVFDVVFTSNVLEHVRELPRLLQEVHRVLAAGGVVIHILPTPAWRLWTSLAHYPFLLAYATGLRRSEWSGVPSPGDIITRRGIGALLRRILVAGPHGEFPNAASELWYFRRRRWRRVFEDAGYELTDDFPVRLYYSGYCLLPRVGIAQRRRLSRLLGSSCRVFVLRAIQSSHRSAG